MTPSLHNYMDVGLVHFMAYPDSLNSDRILIESIKQVAADPFFQVIELTAIADARTRRQVSQMLATARMTVSFGAQPMQLLSGCNVNDLNEDKRKAGVSLLKTGIDQAIELGAKSFSFLSGPYDPGRIEEGIIALIRSCQELSSYALKQGGLQLVLEIFDSEVDKKSLIGPAPLAKRFMEQLTVTNPDFGLLVDLSHIPLLAETPAQALLPIANYLKHVHIGNCVVEDRRLPGYGDSHPRFGFPGGANDVAEVNEFLHQLLAIGYLNTSHPPVLSFEVKPFGQEDPDLVVANAKRVLNKAWARLDLN